MVKNEKKHKKISSKDFKNLCKEEQIEVIQNSNVINNLRIGVYKEVFGSIRFNKKMKERVLDGNT